MVKNPNWQEADLSEAEELNSGLPEPGASGLQVRRHNPLDHAAAHSFHNQQSCTIID